MVLERSFATKTFFEHLAMVSRPSARGRHTPDEVVVLRFRSHRNTSRLRPERTMAGGTAPRRRLPQSRICLQRSGHTQEQHPGNSVAAERPYQHLPFTFGLAWQEAGPKWISGWSNPKGDFHFVSHNATTDRKVLLSHLAYLKTEIRNFRFYDSTALFKKWTSSNGRKSVGFRLERKNA